MNQKLPSRQAGVSAVSLILLFGLIAFFATVTIKVLPLYLNQLKIAKAVSGVVDDPELSSADAGTIHEQFKNRWAIESPDYLEHRDIKIRRNDKGRELFYDYEARAHLFYNIDIVIHFADTRPLRPARNE